MKATIATMTMPQAIGTIGSRFIAEP